ncbi:hypothetical protein D3Y57_04865 (plasmid) [Sphingomonas paeninsulae]|uniref:Uncharacterized protein n=1 Tax=Sphingomonas paeninsulae TaxID=2319844 RepID=A0A494THM4_SPHPE|nr:hypothetical protein D3Y57_04865 [Sphingomonas paeninsulae]
MAVVSTLGEIRPALGNILPDPERPAIAFGNHSLLIAVIMVDHLLGDTNAHRDFLKQSART